MANQIGIVMRKNFILRDDGSLGKEAVFLPSGLASVLLQVFIYIMFSKIMSATRYTYFLCAIKPSLIWHGSGSKLIPSILTLSTKG